MTWSASALMSPPLPPVLSYEPDPPSEPTGRAVEWVCWLLICLLVGFLLTMTTLHEKRTALPTNSDVPSPTFDMTGRIAVAQAVKAASSSGSEKETAIKLRDTLVTSAAESAKTPAEQLAMVTVIFEARGRAAAIQKLDELTPALSQTPALAQDAKVLRRVYIDGPQVKVAADQEKLKKDLGWFGELAVTQNSKTENPQRAAVVKQADGTQSALFGLVSGLVAGGGLGLLLFIIAIVMLAVGSIHPILIRPSPGGPPRMLVVFTIWIYGFFGVSLILSKLPIEMSDVVHETIAFGWTAIAVIAPGIRGTTWARWRSTLGLHSGRGILIEMLCGIGGYLAGLPVLAVGFIVTLLLMKATGVSSTHPIARQLAEKMTVGKVLGLFFLASVLAPILEEAVFRGVLYAHMRRRWNPFVSAVVVALVFAMIHPQGWVAIPVLGSIAFVLAMLREWRGSLIASMTAHGFNNAMALLLGLTLLH